MPAISFKKYRFPLRYENQFELLVEGDCYFTRMLEAIAQARSFIFMEQYLVNSGDVTNQFIEQLLQSAKRGVKIFLLLDDFGSGGLSKKDRGRLGRAGIELCFFNPVHFKHFFNSLFRNHRKILVVDGELAFTGGAGLSDEFSQQTHGRLAWHDVMLAIRGPVVEDWCALFQQTWLNHTGQQIHCPLPNAPSAVGLQTGRVLAANPLHRQEINQALIKQLRRASKRAWITSPYFVPSRKIRRVLRQTAMRGVDVRLLLPGKHSDHPWISFAARRHYSRLLQSGVRIFEYQPRFTHAKIYLCDDWVSMGSSNLDRWNQRLNLDANQAIYDSSFAKVITEKFESDFADSQEIQLVEWQQRPWSVRLREHLSGRLVTWLESLIRKKK